MPASRGQTCAATASPTPPACWRPSPRLGGVLLGAARRRRRGRLGLPAAVAGHRRRARLRAVRHGPEPVGRVPLRLLAAGRWARSLAQRSGLAGSFFAGALAAVVATPCTAPFMGTALGFALTQPAGDQPHRLPGARPRPRPALPAADAGAAADRPPAAPRRLDGDAQAGAGLPDLRHRRLADVGAGPAGRPGRPVRRPDRPRADRRSAAWSFSICADGRAPGAAAFAAGARRRIAGRHGGRRRRPADRAGPSRRTQTASAAGIERFTPAAPRRAARRRTGPCSST